MGVIHILHRFLHRKTPCKSRNCRGFVENIYVFPKMRGIFTGLQNNIKI